MKIPSIIILLGVIVFAGAASAERLAVSAPVANIRSGPGTNHNVLWKVEQYFPILVIQKSGEWYRFQDFEGDKGWVHQSLVGKIQAVITRNDNCNIRSGPGTNHNILFAVEKGIPFKKRDLELSFHFAEGRGYAQGKWSWLNGQLIQKKFFPLKNYLIENGVIKKKEIDPISNPIGLLPNAAIKDAWKEAFTRDDEQFFLEQIPDHRYNRK